mmetsp:Transcript_10022/g.9962  ORF Transcript_10022/g.9962 Transcript_10022/m.9962 type:complete len:88 (+) Transcript_10022:956-1219(+)
MLVGDDFSFYDAEKQYKFTDSLIAAVNAQYSSQYELHRLGGLKGPIFNLSYSTLDCYYKSVQIESEARGITFHKYRGDFFPYTNEQE